MNKSSHAQAMHAVSASPEMEFCPLMPTYGPPIVLFTEGRGVKLYDAEGKEYLDFLAGLAVVGLGHSHPEVAKATAEQAQKLQHVSNLFGTEHNWQLAQEIDGLIDSGSGQVFFCNSGAEANEAAFKLARKFGGHGRHLILSLYGSFHGRTFAALAATGQPEKQEPFAPMLEGFKHIELAGPDVIEAAMDKNTAAVIVEPILGEGGIQPLPEGYLAALRKICDDYGALLILDEIQTGLGRTGDWFGFQHENIEPDVVTIAKALGNGMPIGACWAKKEVAAVFSPGDHATTFGGQPLAAAAARAVLRELKAIDAPQRAKKMGDILAAGLKQLPHISEVRGRGLLLAAELTSEVMARTNAREVAVGCLEAGLVVNAVSQSAIRFAPPLIISESDISQALEIFSSVLEADK